MPGREADAERAFGKTPRMIDVFERVIGVPYAYERYSQIAVADFIFGGMENTSATTQTDRVLHDERAHLDYSADFLAAHELAHQWFGDLVTCRDWSHAWLNEGFATYFEAVWLEADEGWDEYAYDVYGIVQRYLEEDGERYRRPIVCNLFRDPIELFDRHLYEKGGAVLHMLRGELGWERMQRALKRYVRDNAQRNVETIDLVRAIEAETGRNTRRFFAQWVERGGHPELDVAYKWDGERKTALLTIAQKQTVDDDHPAYVFDLEVGFVPDAPAVGRDRLRPGPAAGRDPRAAAGRARAADVRGAARARAGAGAGRSGGLDPLRLDVRAGHRHARRDPARRPLAERPHPGRQGAGEGRQPASPARRWRTRSPTTRSGASAAEVAAALGALARARGARGAAGQRRARAPQGSARGRRGAGQLARRRGRRRAARAARRRLVLRRRGGAARARQDARPARASTRWWPAWRTPSWNDTIGAGALRGLGELADERALPVLLAALDPARAEPLRRAAVARARPARRAGAGGPHASGRRGRARAGRSRLPGARQRVRARPRSSATRGCCRRSTGSPASEDDGRLRRDAAEAAIRIREEQQKPAELARLREELDRLRAESATLRERLDALSPT